MTAEVFNLAIERPLRKLQRGIAHLEGDVAVFGAAIAQTREQLDDLGIDPRALALLKILRSHFASSPAIVAEIDHVRTLLKSSRSDAE